MKFKITKKHKRYYVYQRMFFIWWEHANFYNLFDAEDYIKGITTKEEDVKNYEIKNGVSIERLFYWGFVVLCAIIFYLFNS